MSHEISVPEEIATLFPDEQRRVEFINRCLRAALPSRPTLFPWVDAPTGLWGYEKLRADVWRDLIPVESRTRDYHGRYQVQMYRSVQTANLDHAPLDDASAVAVAQRLNAAYPNALMYRPQSDLFVVDLWDTEAVLPTAPEGMVVYSCVLDMRVPDVVAFLDHVHDSIIEALVVHGRYYGSLEGHTWTWTWPAHLSVMYAISPESYENRGVVTPHP